SGARECFTQRPGSVPWSDDRWPARRQRLAPAVYPDASGPPRAGLLQAGDVLLQLEQQGDQLPLFGGCEASHQFDDPRFVPAGHATEVAAAAGGQVDGEGPAIARILPSLDMAFLGQPVGQAGDVAAGHHQAARELAHLEALWTALELGHEVEARQRFIAFAAQAAAQAAFDETGA